MPKITNEKIEEGMVWGVVRTNRIGSDCEFDLCSVEEYEELTDAEVDSLIVERMWESGYIDLFIKTE